MELKKPESLNKQEIDFCELFIFGCDPYAGNARKCYEDIFYDSSHTSLRKAKQLMARDDVQEYINQLRAIANYETADLKARLTEKLLHIIDETSTAKYTDRRGTELSPAPLRSVAVQASKALMEMYPVKVAQESKVELKGNGDSGIVSMSLFLNLIMIIMLNKRTNGRTKNYNHCLPFIERMEIEKVNWKGRGYY